MFLESATQTSIQKDRVETENSSFFNHGEITIMETYTD